MNAALDDLVPALCVTIDDLMRLHPEQLPRQRQVGFVPKITGAELITVVVARERPPGVRG